MTPAELVQAVRAQVEAAGLAWVEPSATWISDNDGQPCAEWIEPDWRFGACIGDQGELAAWYCTRAAGGYTAPDEFTVAELWAKWLELRNGTPCD